MDPVKTYRYLRLAIIGMVLLVGAAVVHEWWRTGWQCLETSVSSYYYTPARPVLVGALVAMGVCLVVIRGSTDAEDILLNVCGAMTPVIAFVPTPGTGEHCDTASMAQVDVPADVANSVFALLVLGLAVLIVAFLVAHGQRRRGDGGGGRTRARLAIATCAYLVTAGTFAGARSAFIDTAHLAASAVLFLAIISLVTVNAVLYGREHASGSLRIRDVVNRYAVLAATMAAVAIVMLIFGRVYGWQHAELCIEGELVTLFAVFWAIQTRELWWRGVRTARASDEQSPTGSGAG
ncbi:MAG: hypothetical protein L0H79_14680 [Intrasporangium sp.]|uniref:hypothetical protein n=1 Tax=Intrasporangium sp. TaxID=1925024 RepID=UPI0026499555|nr:hypothetical protein [Intrasporangium sp.]MDN5796988.1 hypothetical protein [Intrasporangium sp.]